MEKMGKFLSNPCISLRIVIIFEALCTGAANCPSATPAPIDPFVLGDLTTTPGSNLEFTFEPTPPGGECMVAMWIINTTIVEQHIDDISQLSSLNVSYTEFGDYRVVLYLSNYVSLQYSLSTVTVDEAIIEHSNTTVTAVEQNEISYLNLGVTSGTRFCMFIDWDDDMVENYCLTTLAELTPVGHIYDAVGMYSPFITVDNRHNITTLYLISWVENPVIGLTIDYNHWPSVAHEYPGKIPDENITVVILADPAELPPSFVNCTFIDTADSAILGFDEPDFDTVTTQNISFSITDLGYREIRINCSNHVSFQDDLIIQVEIQQQMEGFAFTHSGPNYPYIPYGDTLTYTLTITNGTNITDTINLGDGSADVDIGPTAAPWPQPLDIAVDHSYIPTLDANGTAPITFTHSLYNAVSGAISLAFNMIVMYQYTDVQVDVANISLPRVFYTFTITTAPPNTETRNCSIVHPLGTTESTSTGTGALLWEWDNDFSSLAPGMLDINVTCSNIGSSVSAAVSVELREAVDGLLVTHIDNLAIATMTSHSFTVSIAQGTAVTAYVYCDYANDPTNLTESVNVTAGVDVTFACPYTLPGTFVVNVTADNLVSMQNATFSVEVIQAVGAIDFTSDSPLDTTLAADAAIVTFTIQLPSSVPYPTGIRLFIDPSGIGAWQEVFLNQTGWTGFATGTAGDYLVSMTRNTYNASCLVNNSVSSLTVFTEVLVIQPMLALTLSGSAIVPALQPATFSLGIDLGSHYNFTIDFGDGSPAQEIVPDSPVFDATYDVQYTYPDAGTYPLNVVAQNPLGVSAERSLTAVIFARYPLIEENIEMRHVDVVARQDNYAYLVFSDTTTPTNQMPSNVNIEVIDNFGNVLSDAVFLGWPDVTVGLHVGLLDLGWVDLQITLDNEATRVVNTSSFYLTERIEQPEIQAPLFVLNNEEFTTSFGYTYGHEVVITVDYGDGTSLQTGGDSAPALIHNTKSYPDAAIFNITAVFTNQLGTLTETATVDVREKLNLNVSTNAPVKTTEDLVIACEVPEGKVAYVSFLIDWGDGTTTRRKRQANSPEVRIEGSYELRHQYTGSGDYAMSVVIDNQVSTQSFGQVINCDEPIEGLSFFSWSYENETEEGIGVTYEPETPIFYRGSYTSGTRVNFSYNIGGLTTLEGMNSEYSFIDAGIYMVTIIAKNFGDQKNFTLETIVASPVGLIGFAMEDKIYLVDNCLIDMELDFAKNICFHFTFNGKKPHVWWFETKEGICAARSLDYDGAHVRLLKNESKLHVMPKFKQPGDYELSLMLYTELKSQRKTFALTVQRYACENPIIDIPITKAGKYWDMPMYGQVSDYVSVTSEDMAAKTDCRETSYFTSQWKLFAVTADDLEGQEVVSDLVDTSLPLYMDCQERALEPRLYRVQFTILMLEFEVFNNSDSLFLQMLPSPLIAGIVPDVLWRLGNVRPIQMNAEHASTDPNIDSNVGLEYEWFCWRLDEDPLEVTTNKSEDGSFDVIAIPPVGSPIPSGGGGCFGTGRGKLDTTAGSFIFDPTTIDLTAYVFTVRVSKEGKASIGKQILTIVEGDPIKVLIRRDTTVQCPDRFWRGGVLNFYSDCQDCALLDQPPEYEWEVADENGTLVDVGDTMAAEAVTGGTNTKVSLTAPPLRDGAEYIMRLHTQVNSSQFVNGISEVILRTSSPPYNGTCTIEPSNAMFLEKPFKITCEGWKDDDFVPGRVDTLKNVITATVAGKTTKIVMDRAHLPLGDPANDHNVTVNIYVTDPCGSYALVTHIVQVRPRNNTGMTSEQFALDFLNGLDSEGMRLESSVVCTAALAIMASFDLSKEEYAPLQSELVAVFRNLLLYGANYPAAAVLAMTDAVTELSKTMTPGTDEQAVATVVDMAGSLGNDLVKQKSVHDTERMVTGLSSLSANCLNIQFAKEAAAASAPPPDPNGIPNPLEEQPPEVQARIDVENRAQAKENLMVVQNVLSIIITTVVSQGTRQHHDVEMGNKDFKVGFTTSSNESLTDTIIKTSEMSARPVELRTDPPCENPSFRSAFTSDNIYGYAKSAQYVSGRVSSLRMYCTPPNGGPLQPVDAYGLILIEMIMHPHDRIQVNLLGSVIDVNTSMIYFTLPIEENGIGFALDFEPIGELYNNQTLHIFIVLKAREEYLYKPTQKVYDIKAVLPNHNAENPWSVVIPDHMEIAPLAYIGILYVNESYNASTPHDPGFRRRKRSVSDDGSRNDSTTQSTQEDQLVPDDMILKNISEFAFDIYAVLATCRSWDTIEEEWNLSGCQLANDSTTTKVKCACTESTGRTNSISPGFTPPGINTIDFSKVFGNFAALLAGNPAVFAVVITTLILYILLLVWARHADIEDIKKWTTQPLVDNVPGDKYFYHITVVTGMRRGGGTKSKVYFVISGEDADTGIRKMDDQYHKGFSRGSSRGFMMTTSAPLGQLTYFRVWHDNSGQNWFLDKIVVEDLQTQDVFFFLCDRWLAVDEDDGQIERILPIAGNEQVLETKNLFYISSRKKLTDEHLWISVFARPERNTFTRAQRLTSGVALLFITMIANALWYRTPDEAVDDEIVRLGPFALSLDILYISVVSSLTSIPISTLIILFFQKARPKPAKPGKPRTGLEPPMCMSKKDDELSETEKKEVKKYKRKYPLPWWFAAIAWVLAVLTILGAAFFVILFSLDWGKVKAEGWLSAFFLCFFENIFIIQPAKVFAVALLISCIWKKLDQEDDKKEIADVKEKPELIEAKMTKSFEPMSKKKLEKARYIGLREKKMWETIQELVLHILFLILVMYLAWGSRPGGTDYFIKHSVLGMLKSKATGDYMPVNKVTDGHKMWTWIRETLLPNIYWQQQYTGDPTPRWSRAYINDQNSIRLGTVRLRQLRIEEERCPSDLPLLTCRPDYGLFTQQDRHFIPGWSDYINETQKNNVKDRLEKAFVYQSFIELQNIPYLGVINTYGGGGYVAELGQGSIAALDLIEKLVATDWVDKRTRAVFFETTIYNVNVHLFASIIALFEFPGTGAVLPRLHVDTFHAYPGVGFRGQFMVAMMVIFVIVLFVMAVLMFIRMKDSPKDFFNEPWNIVEVIFFFMAFVCVGMYGTKEAYTQYITQKISEDKDANIGYMQLSTYEIGFNAVVGITVFIITCKTLRILNFSKQVRDLALSLRLVRQDLLSYIIVFSFVYMAFGLFGMVIFGRHVYDYSTIVTSLESLFSTLLGKFNYAALYDVSNIWGPLFIMFFAVVITFIMINLFIGIVTAAFDEARFDMSAVFDAQVWEYLKYKIMLFIGCGKKEPEESEEEDSDESDKECNGPHEIPDAMRREPRAALHTLDIHLHFLNAYMDQIVKKDKSLEDSAGLKPAAVIHGGDNSSYDMSHILDAQTAALMWDDIPDALLEIMVKSPEKCFGKKNTFSSSLQSTRPPTKTPESAKSAKSQSKEESPSPEGSDTRKSSSQGIDPADLMDIESDEFDSDDLDTEDFDDDDFDDLEEIEENSGGDDTPENAGDESKAEDIEKKQDEGGKMPDKGTSVE